MPTFNAECLTVGGNDAWSLGAGASKPAAVNGAAAGDDDDTTYIETATSAQRQSFVTDAPSLPFRDMTGNYDVTIRVKKVSGTTVFAVAHQRHSSTDQESANLFTAAASYQDGTANFANVPGGSGWTDDQVKNCEIGIFSNLSAATERCTTIYGSFTAEFVAAGFISLVAQLLPGVFSAIGGGLSMREFYRLLQDPRFARKCRLSGLEEHRKHFCELLAYGHPRYLFLGAA